MKTVADFMRKDVVTLRPDETVAAAIQAMLRHHVGGLPVVEDSRLAGIVTERDLLGQALYRQVGDLMVKDVATVSPQASITAAYDLMESRGVGRLPVVQDGILVGIISRRDILRELGRLTDPLTDLPWPGLLRERAAELIRRGQEIVVVFVDLSRFRMVNKRFGHVVGDEFIKAVAGVLQRLTDARDVLARYAGDEFAIVTTRSLEEADALADAIVREVAAIEVPGAQGASIGLSIGLAGGRRKGERPAHPEATVDDLLNLASRASTEAKPLDRPILHATDVEAIERLEEAPPQVLEEDLRLRLTSTSLTFDRENRAQAVVELLHEDRRFQGRADGPSDGLGVQRVLVQATIDALARVLPPGWRLGIEEISFTPLPLGQAINVAVVLATTTTQEILVGSVPYDRHRYDSVVRATLKTVNRRLARLLLKAA